jgi:antitoxin component YwqK of YwqJK toxin-antitoxin module
LRQLETYKNNIKHGEAKYFGGKRYSVMLAHGNFINGKKTGVWTYIIKIEATMEPGFEYYKYTMNFRDCKEGIEGNVAYYYPSNKLFYKTKGDTTTSFYPNGKISSITVDDGNGNTIKEITYDMAGNVLSQKGL